MYLIIRPLIVTAEYDLDELTRCAVEHRIDSNLHVFLSTAADVSCTSIESTKGSRHTTTTKRPREIGKQIAGGTEAKIS